MNVHRRPFLMTLGILAVAGLGAIAPGLFPRFNTWVARATGFFGGEGGSDTTQIDFALQAIHQGGLLPQGPASGVSRNAMPVAYADMIYAFIIEEWGLILGGFGLVLLYLILFSRAIRIGTRCPRPFGSLLAIGLGLMLTFQAMVNIPIGERGGIKIAGRNLQSDAFTDNVTRGENPDNRDLQNSTVSVLYDFTDNFSADKLA